jgi:hypothetical protein
MNFYFIRGEKREAMGRGVRVNAEYFGDQPMSAEEAAGASPAALTGNADYGPCLYLGPLGERCARRAVEGGFCAWHQPGARRPASSAPNVKRIAAVIGALVALLPWLTDLIREVIRLLHAP